jgi:membrane fusion protein (multidrug efflux system)
MKKRLMWLIIIILVLSGIVIGHFSYKMIKSMAGSKGFAPPPVAVTSATAKKIRHHHKLHAVGTLVAVHGTTIAPQVGGIVEKIAFTSGMNVKLGDRILVIRHRDDDADLLNNEAQLSLAHINYRRNKALVARNAVTHSALDTSFAKYQETKAQVEKVRAIIHQKIIEAPFNGQLGIRQVDIGQYISAGTPIVTLQSLDTLYVDFSIPEQLLDKLYKTQQVEVKFSGLPKITFTGKIKAIDSQVNIKSRTALVRAEIPNPQHLLSPGMFVDVLILGKESTEIIVVPQTSISYNLYGDSIYIIKEKTIKGKTLRIALQKDVTTGEMFGDKVEVRKGIKANDLVVTSGQINLHNKSPVTLKNPTPTKTPSLSSGS